MVGDIGGLAWAVVETMEARPQARCRRQKRLDGVPMADAEED
jgi:hypothetical protein